MAHCTDRVGAGIEPDALILRGTSRLEIECPNVKNRLRKVITVAVSANNKQTTSFFNNNKLNVRILLQQQHDRGGSGLKMTLFRKAEWMSHGSELPKVTSVYLETAEPIDWNSTMKVCAMILHRIA